MQAAQKISCRPTCAARPARSAVVVRASAESRRAVLGGFFAGVALTVATAAEAVTPVDLIDDRVAKKAGFDYIYEARDLSLPQNVRDGLVQARSDLESTIERVKQSEARIDAELEPYISKAYWTEAREQLRRQIGTLRFDLNTLASTKTKEEKKKVLALRKEFISKVEDLDFSLRQKDKSAALKKLDTAKAALDNVLAVAL